MYYNTIYINMKYKVVSLLLLSSLALTGCSNSISLEFRPYKPFNYDGEAITQNSIEVSSKAGLEGNIVKTIQDISYRHLNNRTLANSEGEFKMLVLPIYFDANANSPHHDDEDGRAREEKYTIYLENAFFGEAKMTDYESVASYYNKSSYGKLKITGEVAPWFGYSSKVSPTAKKSGAEDIVLAALSHAKTEMGDSYNQYDRDNDGYADDVFVIYDYPYEKDNSSDTIFWAFTSSFGSNKGQAAHGNAYSWASSEFMHPSGNRVETYTYIHETGHLLGLVDYYNTSTSDKTYQPTGMFDMMDSNLGDHSAFSKYSLNWVKPTVITEPGTYKLKSLTKGEQFFLIPKENWNETVYDEYILIEYFVPEGLNDSHNFPNYKYYDKDGKEQIFSYPTKYGIKVYHVDARLFYYSSGSTTISGTPIGFITEPGIEERLTESVSVYYAYQNEGSNQNEILYHLLESSGENSFYEGKGASNETLFMMGDDFGFTKYKDFTFHDGTKCPLKFRIDMLTLEGASITFKADN